MIEALKRTFRSLCGAALAAALFGLAATVPAPAADKVSVVAAENFYGDIAAQIGGDDVAVTSILSNPDAGPASVRGHAVGGCAPSPTRASSSTTAPITTRGWRSCSARRRAANAHDRHRRRAGRHASRATIRISGTTRRPCRRVAKALAAALAERRSRARADYDAAPDALLRLAEADRRERSPSCAPDTRARRSPRPSRCSATWPRRSASTMRNERFQLAVMNDTEPSARDVAAFEKDLQEQRVKLLIYNSQATEPRPRSACVRHRRGAEDPGGRRDRDRAARARPIQDWMLGAARRARQGAGAAPTS